MKSESTEFIVTKIIPEYKESRTKFGVYYELEQYRLDYVLHIPGKTEIIGQHVVDDLGPLDLDSVKEIVLNNLKKAFVN